MMEDSLSTQFICEKCGKRYLRFNAYARRHLDICYVNNTNNVIKCQHCNMEFDTKRQLQHHYRRQCDLPSLEICYDYVPESVEKRLLCRFCPEKTFINKSTYSRHFVLWHIPEKDKTKECEYCGKRFYDDSLVSKHVKAIHVLSHRCEDCDERFSSKRKLEWHRNERHVVDGHRRFPCAEIGCSYSSGNKINLTAHRKNVHSVLETKLFTCEECGLNYKTRTGLLAHINAKHKKLKFLCSICAKELTSKVALANHEKAKHSLEVQICEKCGRKYLNDEKAHQKTCGKFYVCHVCGKQYNTKYFLNLHVKTVHEGIKVQCPHCGSSHTQSGLRRHLKEYCKTLDLLRYFPCPNKCGRVIRAKTELKRHLKRFCSLRKKKL